MEEATEGKSHDSRLEHCSIGEGRMEEFLNNGVREKEKKTMIKYLLEKLFLRAF